ncbi:MAG: class I SAM-dependent methyltransferase, partial [Candidatus Hodarchaeota archaeon]
DEAQKLNLDNITFQCANVEDLPFPDNSFDIVIGEAITALVSNPLGVIKEYRRVLKQGGKIATLDAFRKESDRDEFTDEINEIMTTVLGTEVKVKTLGEWEEIYGKSGFHAIKIRDYYDDIFKRSYSFSEFVQIIFKMLFHMIRSKNIRQKLSPTLRFARKFQRVLKEGDYFGFLIFTGIK